MLKFAAAADDILLADAWRSGVKIGEKKWQRLNQDEDNRRLNRYES
jgi:hypothetical protein